MALTFKPLAYGLGAEVELDIRGELDDGVIDEIREAWTEYLVVVIRSGVVTDEQQIAFTSRFGDLEAHPVSGLKTSNPYILEVTNKPAPDGSASKSAGIGNMWHSDGAYTVRPPAGSLLSCRTAPSVGGDTWFTNMYTAYATISDTLRGIIDQLEVVNDLTLSRKFARYSGNNAKAANEVPAVIHPMVRVHPESGRPSLFISPGVTRAIAGMTDEESEGLLKYLFRHATRPQFTYRHYWRQGDIVMWDNRCTLHLAADDFDKREFRDMHRTTLMGDTTGRLFEEPSVEALAAAR